MTVLVATLEKPSMFVVQVAVDVQVDPSKPVVQSMPPSSSLVVVLPLVTVSFALTVVVSLDKAGQEVPPDCRVNCSVYVPAAIEHDPLVDPPLVIPEVLPPQAARSSKTVDPASVGVEFMMARKSNARTTA